MPKHDFSGFEFKDRMGLYIFLSGMLMAERLPLIITLFSVVSKKICSLLLLIYQGPNQVLSLWGDQGVSDRRRMREG